MRFALSAATLLMVAAGAHVQPVTLGAPKWGCKWIGE